MHQLSQQRERTLLVMSLGSCGEDLWWRDDREVINVLKIERSVMELIVFKNYRAILCLCHMSAGVCGVSKGDQIVLTMR